MRYIPGSAVATEDEGEEANDFPNPEDADDDEGGEVDPFADPSEE